MFNTDPRRIEDLRIRPTHIFRCVDYRLRYRQQRAMENIERADQSEQKASTVDYNVTHQFYNNLHYLHAFTSLSEINLADHMITT